MGLLAATILDQVTDTLLSFLLPEGILDYFELIQADKDSAGLNIYLQEKNIAPEGYQKHELESKGFIALKYFPIGIL